MKKVVVFFKYFVIILFIFVVFLFVSPYLFKKQIVNYLKFHINSQLNAEVDFRDVHFNLIKFFPDISLAINNLSVVGIDKFRGDTLLRVNKFFIGFNLINLLLGNDIIINDIGCSGVKVNIKILRDGSSNYAIFKERGSPEYNKTNSYKVNLRRVIFQDVNIVYEDLQSDFRMLVNGLNFFLKGSFSDISSDLYLDLYSNSSTIFTDGIAWLKNVSVEFHSKFKSDEIKKRYILQNSKLQLNNLALFFDGEILVLADRKFSFNVSFTSKQHSFKDLLSLIPGIYNRYFENITTGGSFTFNGILNGSVDSLNSFIAYNINMNIKDAFLKFAQLKERIDDINFMLRVHSPGDLDVYTVEVQQLRARSLNDFLEGHFVLKSDGRHLSSEGGGVVHINFSDINKFYPLDSVDVSGLMDMEFSFVFPDLYSNKLTDFSTNGRLEIKNLVADLYTYRDIEIPMAEVEFSTQITKINQIKIKYGSSDFYINGYIENIFKYLLTKDQRLKGSLNIQSDFVDVNQLIDYKLNSSQVYSNRMVSTSSVSTEEDTLCFKIPSDLDINFNVIAKKVKYDSLNIYNLIGQLILNQSVAYINNLRFNAIGGNISLSGFYDASNYLFPHIAFKYKMEDIQLSDIGSNFTFIKGIAPIVEKINGNVNMDLIIDMKLNYAFIPFMHSLNGQGVISTSGVSIQNNQVFNLIASATGNNNFRNPSITDLNLTFKMVNGNIIVPQTTFNLSDAKIVVEGRSNIDRTIDFHILMEVKPQKVIKIISVPLTGFTNTVKVSIKIGGTIDYPQIKQISTNLFPSITINNNEDLSPAARSYLASVEQEAQDIVNQAKMTHDSLLNIAYLEADKLKRQAHRQADSLLNIAEVEVQPWLEKLNNPLLRRMAKRQIKKIRRKAKHQADKIIKDAQKKADKIINKAKKQGDKIVSNAEKQAHKMITEAKKRAKNM